ncbi:MAG TPA: BolA family protein [Polyangiaceae bacterium]|nr:BolA family protein [Polyangiaceae bacterium]
MQRRTRIETTLTQAFGPTHLEVIDESHNHAVKPGAESHFKVVVVAPAFAAKSGVQRHQLVYGALKAELQSGLHALTITARTPAEWSASPVALVSPPCAGATKE